MTASVKDFRVGQRVFVRADQGIRKGTVTKLGRTRVSVRHPRNLKGDMVERAYPMGEILLGQFTRVAGGRLTPPLLLWADGWYGPASNYPAAEKILSALPTVLDPDSSGGTG